MKLQNRLQKIWAELKAERIELEKLSIFLFLLIASHLLIAPLIHEAAHILILELENCFYSLKWSFNFPLGITAGVEPFCYLNNAKTFIFYVSGHLSVLVAGSALSLWSLEFHTHEDYLEIIAGSFGSGLLFSLAIGLTLRGDLQNIMILLNIPTIYGLLIQSFIYLGASATSFRVLQIMFGPQKGKNDARGRE